MQGSSYSAPHIALYLHPPDPHRTNRMVSDRISIPTANGQHLPLGNNCTPNTMIMSSEAIPSTRVLLTRLINHLSTFSPSPRNSSSSVTNRTALFRDEHEHEHEHPLPPPTAKSLLLTLHSLLPHCLLPALDLLDHGLVERWIPLDPNSNSNSNPNPNPNPTGTSNPSSWVYYITSKPVTPEHTNPFHSTTPSTYTYEVRPSVWHCTCANFALYAFASAAQTDTVHTIAVEVHVDDKESWMWGSQNLSPSHPSAIPVCKHLLAAVLSEQCPTLFGALVKEKQDVSRDEMAEKAIRWD